MKRVHQEISINLSIIERIQSNNPANQDEIAKLAVFYEKLGRKYSEAERFDKAIKAFNKSNKLIEKFASDSKYRFIKLYNYAGVVRTCIKLNQMDRAESLANGALDMVSKWSGDLSVAESVGIVRVTIAAGECSFVSGNNQDAINKLHYAHILLEQIEVVSIKDKLYLFEVMVEHATLALRLQDYEKADFICCKIAKNANNTVNERVYAYSSYTFLGHLAHLTNNNSRAIKYYSAALEIMDRHDLNIELYGQQHLIDNLNQLAKSYYSKGEYVLSEKYFLKSLELSKSMEASNDKETEGYTEVLDMLGRISIEKKDDLGAVKYFQEGVKLLNGRSYLSDHEKEQAATYYSLMGLAYRHLEKKEDSLRCFESSNLLLCTLSHKKQEPIRLAIANHCEIAQANYLQQNYDIAMEHNRSVLRNLEKFRNLSKESCINKFKATNNMALCFFRTKKFAQGMEYLFYTIELCQQGAFENLAAYDGICYEKLSMLELQKVFDELPNHFQCSEDEKNIATLLQRWGMTCNDRKEFFSIGEALVDICKKTKHKELMKCAWWFVKILNTESRYFPRKFSPTEKKRLKNLAQKMEQEIQLIETNENRESFFLLYKSIFEQENEQPTVPAAASSSSSSSTSSCKY